MKRIKICFFIPFYPVVKGGAEYQARILADHLRGREAYEIIFVSEVAGEDAVRERDGYKVYEVGLTKGPLHRATLYYRFMKRVTAVFDRENPDIIYQRILNTFSYRIARYARSTGKPFVLHIADNYSLEFGNGLRSALKRWMTKKVLSGHTQVICQSRYQAELLQALGHEPIMIMPNIHPPIRRLDIKRKKERIVWIGNVRPVKQLEVFLGLSEEAEPLALEFHVIGGIPETKYGRTLKADMERRDNVYYHGQKGNDFIVNALHEAGLLVNTSRSEGFPNTFIQSWMCGTPVVSLNSDPLGLIEKYGVGYYCNGDPGRLFTGIQSVLNSKDYDEIADLSVRVSHEYFSIEKNLDAFVGVLNQALKKENGDSE